MSPEALVHRGIGYWLTMLLAVVVGLTGILLAAGGIWLISLGGSWYYLVAGIGLLATAVLMLTGRELSLYVYVATWLFTLVWALWEVGLNGWALVPRLAAPTVILVLMLFAWPVLRRLHPVTYGREHRHVPGAVTATVVLFAGVIVAAGVGLGHLSVQAQQDAAPSPAGTGIADPAAPGADWPVYGGSNLAARFSSLNGITPQNVGQLKKIWTYRTGDMPSQAAKDKYSPETTPIKVGDTLYLCSAKNIVLAVDAATGKENWRYDPKVSDDAIPYGASCRGVSYYTQPNAAPGSACASRIIEGTLDGRLIAVDAADGQPCAQFGTNGQVDLLKGIGETVPGWYSVTAPPMIVRNVVVTGAQVQDGQAEDAPSGVIRGYDAVTGKFLWAWDMGRPDVTAEPGPGETYTRGTPNMWTAASGDDQLGYVYVPLGNSSVDYFGGNRKDYENKYSSSVVALDVTTGKPVWNFQTVHYDVWDYDLGSQPSLIDFPTGSGTVPALVLPSKQGQIYILDRRTGQPLTPVEERQVPNTGSIEADKLSPTQPFSGYHSLVMPDLKEADMWGMTPLDQLWCRIQFHQANYFGPYTPPSHDKPFIEYPSYNGGSDWGSVAVDEKDGIMVVNYNDMPNYDRLLTRAEADKKGWKPINALGGGSGGPDAAVQTGAPYAADINAGWIVPFTGLMCKQPPYGGIRAIDLKTGRTLWDEPLGDARGNGPWGLKSLLPIPIGTPNNGGSVITAGGIVFIAASTDNVLRAIDIHTGKVLWSDQLPAGGQATPMTFEADGHEVVAIFAGGHHFMKTPVGDYLVAYALPEKQG